MTACNQASAPVVCRCMEQPNSQLLGGIRLAGHVFPQNCPLPFGDRQPHVPSPLIIPNGISIGSAVFVWIPNAMLYNALSMGKKTTKIAPTPLGFRHPAGCCRRRTETKDRATAIGVRSFVRAEVQPTLDLSADIS